MANAIRRAFIWLKYIFAKVLIDYFHCDYMSPSLAQQDAFILIVLYLLNRDLFWGCSNPESMRRNTTPLNKLREVINLEENK